MSKYTSIPEFSSDVDSLAVTVRAIKDVVEQLAGIRIGASLGAPMIFVQGNEPLQGVDGNVLTRGDLWVNPETRAISFFDGSVWTAFTGVEPP